MALRQHTMPTMIDTGRRHYELVDVDLKYTTAGIEVVVHGKSIAVICRLKPGHWMVNGMQYDRLHMAIRDVVKKHWMENGH